MSFILSIFTVWMNIALASVDSSARIFTSEQDQTTLLELYSSQGCSSCPPAQQWVNDITNNPKLWQDIIPIVFHVNYWDYIGWRDPFGNESFSQRQREYAKQGAINSVYTPGFVANGQEWTGWFAGKGLSLSKENVGVLQAKTQGDALNISFDGELDGTHKVNIAILGFDLLTKVRRGENARKTLEDNFVVLAMDSLHFENNTTYQLPDYSMIKCDLAKKGIAIEKTALVVWLSDNSGLNPIQAVGGYL
ncbi:DUF1223 domain-containing protein [Agaribacter marinus]|uniref:DUF1223 domain-containing protein n=1 Tax=Agaribacter marinus TaxID=1431249 RepID=A0AA37T0P8_9ALTE|nr:DUF1223 domain-containing protein [Agaribacter marinus]GLR71769.1 hypothetical protein GCM10007852_26770 [Agaribacter marinus]